MERGGYTYILTNKYSTVFYVGVTSNLFSRMQEHKDFMHEGFTKRYGVTKLVYYEIFEHIEEAIEREKKLKAGTRAKKLALILKGNLEFNDLTANLEY